MFFLCLYSNLFTASRYIIADYPLYSLPLNVELRLTHTTMGFLRLLSLSLPSHSDKHHCAPCLPACFGGAANTLYNYCLIISSGSDCQYLYIYFTRMDVNNMESYVYLYFLTSAVDSMFWRLRKLHNNSFPYYLCCCFVLRIFWHDFSCCS